METLLSTWYTMGVFTGTVQNSIPLFNMQIDPLCITLRMMNTNTFLYPYKTLKQVFVLQ